MTFVEVKFECINWWGNGVYRLLVPKRLYKKYADAQHRVDKHKELTPMERTRLYGYLNPKYHFADYPRKRVH